MSRSGRFHLSAINGAPIAITGSSDVVGGSGEVMVWDLATSRQRASFTRHTQPVNAVACTHLPDGTPIAITGSGGVFGGVFSGGVIVWDLVTGRQRASFTGHTRSVNAVACIHLPDGTPIAITGSGDVGGGDHGEVMVWDLVTGRQRASLTGHIRRVNAVACTHLPDGAPIAITGGADAPGGVGEVMVWDLVTGRQRASLTGHIRRVNAVACTHLPDGTPIAITGGADAPGGVGEVIVWDLATGRQRATLAVPYPVTTLACDSNQGVIIGAATEVIRLEYATRR